MGKIQRALISVTDKSLLGPFAQELAALDIEIISSGGTARFLKEHGVKVQEVSDYTGSPEILDGRVKTLHPKIAGGILAVRGNPTHHKQCEVQGIKPIDLVVVNLYAFEETIAKPQVTLGEAIENIDIGGPTLVRAAAKNHHDVAIIVDPADYESCLTEMKKNQGSLSNETRARLARKAFALTARYDTAISRYLGSQAETNTPFPPILQLSLSKVQDLRYGENPHQRAALYRNSTSTEPSIPQAEQLQGKELSFNNLIDLNAALEIAKAFAEPAAVVIKHTNPAGVGIDAKDIHAAFVKARDSDPVSAFGGVIGVNRPVNKKLAEEIAQHFYECIIAPDYDKTALEIFAKKKNLRLLKLENFSAAPDARAQMVKAIRGGLLVQDRDQHILNIKDCTVPTKREPTDKEWAGLQFVWKVAQYVKSNAIVFGRIDRTLGIGAGQMSRVDATRIAAQKAKDDLQGAVMASDAFFPFRDNIDLAAKVGIAAIISPGGSVRDDEVIAAAGEHDIALVFTGIRHFLH